MKTSEPKHQPKKEKPYLGEHMSWIDNLSIQAKGIKLNLTPWFELKDPDEESLSVFKSPAFVRDYIDCLAGIETRHVVEVGILQGGSAIFFWNLLMPEKFCCIELESPAERLEAYIENGGLSDRFSTYYHTNQADKPKLHEILTDQFGESALDVVIDDASHLYSPSLATFEVMFPKLRQGGLYFLEDWKVHSVIPDYGREPNGEEPPFHRLVHELLNIALVHPDIIHSVKCYHNFVVFERGKADLPKDWDVPALLARDSENCEY